MNDADRHLLTIFSAALERDPAGARAAFLDEACAGSPDLRARVEALLLAHGQAGRFLEPGEAPAAVAPSPDIPTGVVAGTASYGAPSEGVGATIGPYRLLQAIGEGGMGTVYLAEQSEPVRRRVALKVIKPGMDGRQVLARFEAERQALAMMDHPNIAKVLDAGATPNGRPYFAMELVKGVSITKFCDDRKLSPRERLDLFLHVCHAVQHAHQKGVIHRDLKPSNVLVALYDDKPVPKVIDFGIAKAAGAKLTEQTVFTDFGAIIGTLEYMSPEQAQLNQLDVDTRSDVYSLGVLLYELLTGTTPMQRKSLGQLALLEVLRQIREAETPRPSLRLSTDAGLPSIAANRGLEPKKLSGLMRGDLDWIVMKALEKDRSRRYETANALARDLQRHLNNEDVEACPPSAAYRLRKFARRHRVGLSLGATIAVVLLAATAVSTWQAVRATRAEREALDSAEVERLTNEFFIVDLLGKASLTSQVMADIPPDPDIKVRTLIDRAAARIDGRFAGQPLVEAAVRRMIGNAYDALGLYGRARPYFERSYELRRQFLGEAHPATLEAEADLGQVETHLGQYDRAEARLRRTLDLATRQLGEGDGRVIAILGLLGGCLDYAGRHDEGDGMMLRALDLARRDPTFHPEKRLALQNNRAISLTHRGREAEAEASLEDSLREAIASVGEGHPLVPLIRNNLALAQRQVGRIDRAAENARKALDACRKLYGETHPYTLAAMQNVGHCQMASGRHAEAETTIRAELELAGRAYGPESETALYAAMALADVLRQKGRTGDAESLLRGLLEPARRLGRRAEVDVEVILASAASDAGRFPEAERLFRKVDAEYKKPPPPQKRRVAAVERELAHAIAGQGRHGEAGDLFRDLLGRCEADFGPDDILTYQVLASLTSENRAVGRLDEAEAAYPRLLELGRRLIGEDAPNVLAARNNFAALLHVRGRFEAAEAQYRAALDSETRTLGPEFAMTLQTLSNLGELYRDWGRPEQAVPILARALEALERTRGPEDIHTLWTLWKFAELDRDRGRLDEAGAKFRRCLAGYAKAQGDDGLELAMLRADLAMNHMKRREPGLAEPLFRQALLVYDRQMPDDWRRFEIQGQLGEALAALGKHAEAEPLVLGGYEGLKHRNNKVTVDAWPRLPEAGRRVVRLYESWSKPDQVALWKGKLDRTP